MPPIVVPDHGADIDVEPAMVDTRVPNTRTLAERTPVTSNERILGEGTQAGSVRSPRTLAEGTRVSPNERILADGDDVPEVPEGDCAATCHR